MGRLEDRTPMSDSTRRTRSSTDPVGDFARSICFSHYTVKKVPQCNGACLCLCPPSPDGRLDGMAELRRFGVSIEKELLKEFDLLIGKKGYANRSDALRALIRSNLLEERTRETPDMEVIATIALVYDHGAGDLPTRLTDIQHRWHQTIVSTLHVHFDQHNCLEVLVVRGMLKAVRSIADSIIGTRGVRQGKLLINAATRSDGHGHSHHGPSTGREA